MTIICQYCGVNMKKLIYSVEEETDRAAMIRSIFIGSALTVVNFSDLDSFWAAAAGTKPDWILVDLPLSDQRRSGFFDKLSKSFGTGCKVFDLRTLESTDFQTTLRALKLRLAIKPQGKLTVGDITVDIRKHLCQRAGKTIRLTPREFEILSMLLDEAGQTVDRVTILSRIWGVRNRHLATRTVDMHIKEIRRKLGDRDQTLIKSIYGIGYRIDK